MTAMTLKAARDRLAEVIQRHGLPLPDMTTLAGSVLLVRLADAEDVAPWSAALQAQITPCRESSRDGSRRWGLVLSRRRLGEDLWIDVYWEGSWFRVVPPVPPGVVGLPIGRRHGRKAIA